MWLQFIYSIDQGLATEYNILVQYLTKCETQTPIAEVDGEEQEEEKEKEDKRERRKPI